MTQTLADAPIAAPAAPPEPGQLARVRGRMWVVGDVVRDSQASLDGRPVQHLVSLVSVEDDATGEELEVVWEIEPGTAVVERAELPQIAADRLDDPAELDAFLDAVRWGAVTSADQRSLQAPFRSGITIEDYQLEPLVRALRMPRTTLLIADDVGLGKTIEAGLVVQELLLRHRARTALVVCPAALQLQWRDEMREKFGLEFRIVDRELLGQLRRSRGVGANPFAHFPRLIVSIDWLKGELGMRLLREVLPPHPEIPRRYDILIVDEVHNCAPAGAGGRYARDTLRTAAIRTLAPHCEHRLFLSATPHNGYDNSFAALLELLDPHRFARGIKPTQEATREVTVRRLKQDLLDDDGKPRFARRKVVMLEVEHPDSGARGPRRPRRLRRRPRASASAATRRATTAADFVVTLLKKRLFSSPAAFLRTLEVHRETLAARAPRSARRRRRPSCSGSSTTPRTRSTRRRARTASATPHAKRSRPRRPTEAEPPDARGARAARRDDRAGRGAPPSPRTREPRRCWTGSSSNVKPGGRFSDERVIVFTEYRATQRYLQERLAARGIAGNRVELLDGTTDDDERERIKSQWQEPPTDYPVRVLLATDAASEGISLQRHCHLLAHAEIPWNPNRLEQRNGRVDRHGQTARAKCSSTTASAPAGRPRERGSLEGDLDFLARVVHEGRADPRGPRQRRPGDRRPDRGGDARPPRARSTRRALRGAAAASRALLAQERRMRERLAALRDELHESRTTLHLQPERVERVVATALALARQPALTPGAEAGHVGGPRADRQLVARDDRPRAPRPPRRAPADHVRPRARARAHRRRARPSRPSARADGARAAARRGLGHRATTCTASRCATPTRRSACPSRSRTGGSSSPARPATGCTSS